MNFLNSETPTLIHLSQTCSLHLDKRHFFWIYMKIELSRNYGITLFGLSNISFRRGGALPF